MKKFRIIEMRYPFNEYYDKGVSDEPSKDISFSNPRMFLQERKSIFHKWKTIKPIDSILEAKYFIYNRKVEKIKPIKRVIGKL